MNRMINSMVGPTGSSAKGDYIIRIPSNMQVDDDRAVKQMAKKLEKQGVPNRMVSIQKKVGLFKHLQQSDRNFPLTKTILLVA